MFIHPPKTPNKGCKRRVQKPSPSTMAALANAIADATGVRLRATPFTADRVWQALREAGY